MGLAAKLELARQAWEAGDDADCRTPFENYLDLLDENWGTIMYALELVESHGLLAGQHTGAFELIH